MMTFANLGGELRFAVELGRRSQNAPNLDAAGRICELQPVLTPPIR
jgi:hypothetical protein